MNNVQNVFSHKIITYKSMSNFLVSYSNHCRMSYSPRYQEAYFLVRSKITSNLGKLRLQVDSN